MDTASVETSAASSRLASGATASALKDTPDHSDKAQDGKQTIAAAEATSSTNDAISAKTTDEQKLGQGQDNKEKEQPQSFTAAVFPGFNPPKINTSAFFSSMQGKIQSTLAGAKSPTMNLQSSHINKVDIKQIQASTEQLANTTKDWGVSAFKSLSNAAQRVSANVTQGIQKEHEDFVRQKKMDTVIPRQGTEKLPAWVGLPDEEKIKTRILSLSKDKRNFLLPPPPGTDFVFDMNAYSSTAVATLKQDPNLDKMRFYLVPKEVEELVFWRNYFYRVSLLKQVALAAASGAPDSLAEAASNSTSGEGAEGTGHARSQSVSSALGYNIYFGTEDVEGPPRKSRPTSKDLSVSSSATKDAAKTAAKTAARKQEKKPEVLFEANMPDHDEDPDAWLEKQLASGATIGDGDDDDADVDVADWEKELQNELKDYVEGS